MRPNDETTGDDLVLFVDDDENILSAFRRQYQDVFNLVTASSPREALQLLSASSHFKVMVTDFQMPVMTGVELCRRVESFAPDLVRIILTGDADVSSALQAVNDGHVFRYLLKPCETATFVRCVREALAYAASRRSERALLEGTVIDCLDLLTQVLSLTAPNVFDRAIAVRNIARRLSAAVGATRRWEIEAAALLLSVGKVSLPSTILDRVQRCDALEPGQSELVGCHASFGAELIRSVEKFDAVAELVALQDRADFTGLPHGSLREALEIVVAARILDEREPLRLAGATPDEVLKSCRAGWSLALLEAARSLSIDETETEVRALSASALRAGMVLEHDALGKDGAVVMAKGQTLAVSHLMRLTNHRRLGQLSEPLHVRVELARASRGPDSSADGTGRDANHIACDRPPSETA